MGISLDTLVDHGHIVIHDVSWGFYQQISEELEDRKVHITFDNGDLEIMAPAFMGHESWKNRIGLLIEIMCLEREIEIRPAGEMTLDRKDLAKATQPDESYYIRHADEIGGNKVRVDLKKDPPPDLAVEIDTTRTS